MTYNEVCRMRKKALMPASAYKKLSRIGRLGARIGRTARESGKGVLDSILPFWSLGKDGIPLKYIPVSLLMGLAGKVGAPIQAIKQPKKLLKALRVAGARGRTNVLMNLAPAMAGLGAGGYYGTKAAINAIKGNQEQQPEQQTE